MRSSRVDGGVKRALRIRLTEPMQEFSYRFTHCMDRVASDIERNTRENRPSITGCLWTKRLRRQGLRTTPQRITQLERCSLSVCYTLSFLGEPSNLPRLGVAQPSGAGVFPRPPSAAAPAPELQKERRDNMRQIANVMAMFRLQNIIDRWSASSSHIPTKRAVAL